MEFGTLVAIIIFVIFIWFFGPFIVMGLSIIGGLFALIGKAWHYIQEQMERSGRK